MQNFDGCQRPLRCVGPGSCKAGARGQMPVPVPNNIGNVTETAHE